MNFNGVWNKFLNNIMLNLPDIMVKLLQAIVVIILAVILIKFGQVIITKFFHKQKTFKYSIDDKRADTLSTLLVSILRYTVYIIAFLTIINSIFGIKISTILTLAGIGGVAFGLGAQSLVRDVISGFLILFEDQFVVGDSITIDGMSGSVEEVGMRITKLRHFNGDLFIIPNGEIKKVTNHTRGSKTGIVDVHVPYDINLDKVIECLKKASAQVVQEFEGIVEEYNVLGVVEFSPTDITLRVVIKTLPSEHVKLERELRKKIKDVFDKEGIMIAHNLK